MSNTRIKILRKENGFTQTELAKMIGVTPQAVFRWENNKLKPCKDNLAKLSKIFNTSIENILSNSDEE